jgi:hypothetical protein
MLRVTTKCRKPDFLKFSICAVAGEFNLKERGGLYEPAGIFTCEGAGGANDYFYRSKYNIPEKRKL